MNTIPDAKGPGPFPLPRLLELAKELGPVFRVQQPWGKEIILSSYELVNDVCDDERFEKDIVGGQAKIREVTGDALFTSTGDDEPNWGKAHRILTPSFGPAQIRNYFESMLDIADQMMLKWERFGAEEPIEVLDNMTRLALDTVVLCGLGFRSNLFYKSEIHPFVQAVVRMLSSSPTPSGLAGEAELASPSERQFQADGKYMREITGKLLAGRRRLGIEDPPKDLLSMMLSTPDPLTGERLDDDNIERQLIVFMIAGHETTSKTLSFATHYLLKNPDVMQRAREEADRVLGSGMPRFEHLSQLGYLEQIARETLRFRPPVALIKRRAKEDTLLAGRFPLKKGETVSTLLAAYHQDTTVWENPTKFDPDRYAKEKRETILPNGWLPFGIGKRSCLGRSFAIPEMTLTLGMMLQRFDISTAKPYELEFAPHERPDGIHIQARVRKTFHRTQLAPIAPQPEISTAPDVKGVTSHGTPLLLLYGSNSGASEAFARRMASDGSARGYVTKVAPLDDYAGKVVTEGAVVILTSSYNGQPPDNARSFVSWLTEVPAGALDGVRYAVFGCGNRDWATTYQAVPKLIDERLQQAGAQTLLARGEADGAGDFFGDFDRWYTPFWETMGAALSVKAQAVASGPLYEVRPLPSIPVEAIERAKLQFATIMENRELVDMTSPMARSKRHIEFKLPPGTTYAAGDYLAVLPENDPELVTRAARWFKFGIDDAVVLRSTRGAMAASLPTDRPVTMRELLGRHVELSAPATQKDVAKLAEKNSFASQAERMAQIAVYRDVYDREILEKRVSVLDLLQMFPETRLSFADFLDMVPPMRVRQYSISSSPRWSESHCTLTVGIVDGPAKSGIGRFRGTASGYLARLRRGDRIAVAVKSPNVPFHPPPSNSTPMIMICAGTGLAPFRGFIQERALRLAEGEPVGDTLLFFGCDHPEVDFTYRDELTRWSQEGAVEVFPAYSKQPDGDVMFVQHRVWKDRKRIREAFKKGGIVYLCGDGKRMAPAVRQALTDIYREGQNSTDAEASAWLAEMEKVGRYVPDVFA